MARSWTSCRRVSTAVLAEEPFPIGRARDGEDIMRVRNIKPGPEVGRIKQRLTELVMDGVIEPSREACWRTSSPTGRSDSPRR